MVLENREIKVVGMHCPSCAAAVELSMKDLEGVEEAKADFEKDNVVIEYDSTKVSDEDLANAVEEAGFKVE